MTPTGPVTPDLPVGLRFGDVPDERWLDFARAAELAFADDLDVNDAELWQPALPEHRRVAVYEGGTIVGTAAAYDFSMTVPAVDSPAGPPPPVPTDGITLVGVLPTHRRQGLLGAMLRRQFELAHERSTPLAALWASESSIYGRFGYGCASQALSFTLAREHARLLPSVGAIPSGRTRMVDPKSDEALDLLAGISEQLWRTGAGRYRRSREWLRQAVHTNEYDQREEGSLRLVVHEPAGGGAPDGFLTYGVKCRWEDHLPSGRLSIRELEATTLAARLGLWRYVFGLDLVSSLYADNVAIDDPVLSMLADPRRAVSRVRDALFVRLIDVATALSARTYQVPIDVTFRLTDRGCPWNEGIWHLAGDSSGATCERTSAPADLDLGPADLGAVYLGGPTLRTLAAAGRVQEHTAGAVAAASAAFHTDAAPFCPELF